MRTAFVLLLVGLGSIPARAATIAIDLPELAGRYENGDTRTTLVFGPSGGLLAGASLRLTGTTDCASSCDPPVSFYFGFFNITVASGSFDFEAPLFGSLDLLPLFGVYPVSVVVGVPSPITVDPDTQGTITYNGFYGASAGISGLVPPRLSSPVIVTSASLILQTVPEPGLAALTELGLCLWLASRRLRCGKSPVEQPGEHLDGRRAVARR